MSGPDFKDPKSFNFPDGSLLLPEQTDNLGRALISLLREVCVLTDRQLILEQALADQGIDVSHAVNNYQPDEALQKRLDDKTGAIIDSVIGDLTGQG
ncbi:MAG: hypothetical protein ABJO01_06385 [Parasphingorhabdus sp.]|uniref:hypothetical protein n=1 Tax=Parasphingorhabdus sp. TaxID=2709688 RepID=UPI003296CA9B